MQKAKFNFMNRENLIKLAKFALEIPPEQFSMKNWLETDDDCKTIGCIIGHASFIFPEEALNCTHHNSIFWTDFSKDISGLEYHSPEWV